MVAAAALVIPQGLLDKLLGCPATRRDRTRTRRETERRAVAAVLAAERAPRPRPEEMPHNNPGYDIVRRTATAT